jgi:hypothetical protein
MGICIDRICNLGGLNVESLEMIGIRFEVFDFAVDKGRQLSVKG